MEEKKRVIYGTCCVCELPCYSGQDLIAGAPDCNLRHKECVQPKRPLVSEK